MGRFAGDTACTSTKDQHFVEHGEAGVQPARAFLSSLRYDCSTSPAARGKVDPTSHALLRPAPCQTRYRLSADSLLGSRAPYLRRHASPVCQRRIRHFDTTLSTRPPQTPGSGFPAPRNVGHNILHMAIFLIPFTITSEREAKNACHALYPRSRKEVFL